MCANITNETKKSVILSSSKIKSAGYTNEEFTKTESLIEGMNVLGFDCDAKRCFFPFKDYKYENKGFLYVENGFAKDSIADRVVIMQNSVLQLHRPKKENWYYAEYRWLGSVK